MKSKHHSQSLPNSKHPLPPAPGEQGVYFDYAATTPVASEVAAAMGKFLTQNGTFGNPHSTTHRFGHAALEAVNTARQDVATLINAAADEIVWTSGATEAINLAIKGVMLSPYARGRHLVITALEHKAVLENANWLSRAGFDVTHVAPDPDGMITPAVIEAALRPDTALVSVMHVNNEVGTITDIPEIARVVRDTGAVFHVDAAQSAARLPLDVSVLGMDLLSLSAHKIYGPKGIGALFLRRSIRSAIAPQTHGGGQEGGLRGGTLPTHQIVGLGFAARLVANGLASEASRLTILDHRLLRWLEGIDGATVNGNALARVPGIMNIAFPGVEAESLMIALSDIAIATGSACTSAAVEPSHVLRALGISDALAQSSVRLSFGRYTTEAEIDFVGHRMNEAVSTLRSIAV